MCVCVCVSSADVAKVSTNDEFCIKNEELCIQNNLFCINMMNLKAERSLNAAKKKEKQREKDMFGGKLGSGQVRHAQKSLVKPISSVCHAVLA